MDEGKVFADNLAIDIKVEHDDESQSTEITQNDDDLQLDVKREVDEEITEIIDEFSAIDDSIQWAEPPQKI